MFIVRLDPQSNREIVEYLTGDLTPEQLAAREGWLSWRVITPEESAELQRPTPAELVAQFEGLVEARLNDWAVARGWENLDRVLAQTGHWKTDAVVAQAAYDAAWEMVFALDLESLVAAGQLTPEEALANLPPLPEWPGDEEEEGE